MMHLQGYRCSCAVLNVLGVSREMHPLYIAQGLLFAQDRNSKGSACPKIQSPSILPDQLDITR